MRMEIYGCPGIFYNQKVKHVADQAVVAMYESWELGERSGSLHQLLCFPQLSKLSVCTHNSMYAR